MPGWCGPKTVAEKEAAHRLPGKKAGDVESELEWQGGCDQASATKNHGRRLATKEPLSWASLVWTSLRACKNANSGRHGALPGGLL